jgi:pectin methylesterase-like acyl-CoA thioesterase
MLKLMAAVGAAAALFALGPAGAWSRGAADTLCVGDRPGCYATIQAALDAAQDGDTIRVGPGGFAGGITIDKSVDLVGAGAKATVIDGGGPVVTVGEFLGTSELTVTISGVTVSGG